MPERPNIALMTDAQKEALIMALWDELEHIKQQNAEYKARLLELEQNKPKKNSRNSSVPPSRDHKANKSAPDQPRQRRKASFGRKGGGRRLHPNPDQHVVSLAKVCPHCEGALERDDQHLESRYDKIEIPRVRPLVTRVEQYGGTCPHCGDCYVAPVPVGLEVGTPFGRSIETLATYLRYTHAISYERLCALFGEVFGLSISEGALANLFEKRVGSRLADRTQEILERLRSSRLVMSDETSARVEGRNQWEWVFQNAEVCVHVIRPSRGHGVIDEVMDGHRPEVWVSDLYSAQGKHPAAHWQLCLAHQLRDVAYAIESGDEIFAPRMKRVLLRGFALEKQRDRLKESVFARYRRDLSLSLEKVLALEPVQKDGIRLKKRYVKHRAHLFLFLDDASVPSTNNTSEQALRLSVIFRKVTNGFRSDWGRDLFASVRSVVNTGRREGMTAFESIQKALSPIASFFLPV